MSIARSGDSPRLVEEADLAPWAKRALERAYQCRARARCSREDFADGWIAALVELRAKSAFLPGTLE